MTKRVPEIRFEGFRDDWEQRRLGKIAPLRGGFAFKSSEFQKEGIPIVRISNILTTGEVGGDFIYYPEQVKDDNYLLPDRSAVLAMSGATTGKVSVLSNPNGGKVYQNQRVGYFTKTDVADYGFISTITRSQMFIEQLGTMLVAGAQPNISSKDIDMMNFTVPTNLEEQTKIGSFFQGLDNTITLHQRKLEQLQSMKDGFLQKMFPKDGEKEPEIRFSGFTDDWEQRKLGELSEISRGASPRPIQDPKWFDKDSDIGWLRIADVTEQNGRITQLEQKISNLAEEKTRVLLTPHLLLSIAATVGKPVINYVKTGVHDGFLIFYKPQFDQEFMFQWLEMFRPKWQKYGQPGSQVNLNSELVKNQEILLPSLDEQIKISTFFKSLDDTIALHQRELELLKQTKKAFLQKMFV